MTAFIDLDRQFHKSPDQKNLEELAQKSYLLEILSSENTLSWPNLLQHPLTVILGEPGSGKSTELQLQVDKLRGQGKTAFFVRLDRVVNEALPAVLGESDRLSFKDWKKRDHVAWFFFDSVDESKLRRPDDFLTALDRIYDAIGVQELRRAPLIFTSRISEWRPITDVNALRVRFCLPNQINNIENQRPEATYGPLGPRDESYTVEQQRSAEPPKDSPLVVYLAPLDRGRVSGYAQWLGLSDPEAFIEALQTNHAWEFARRPLDVNGLVEYWRQYGRLGTLTELIENSLMLLLRETEPRETTDLLTPINARQGSEVLAAAVLLCGNLNIRVPDDAFVPATPALEAAKCLPGTWSTGERRTLLTRPLFDGATYGTIRFHHRRMMEYLAVSWMNRCMDAGCPLDRLEDILFERHQGDYILRPNLAPVAAWLANGNNPHNRQVRERLLAAEPEIHFRYGDPAQLPLEYKRRVLNAIFNLHSGRRQTWLKYDPQALARLAEPALAADVSGLISNRDAAGSLRTDLLQLVRYGRLTDCLESALYIIAAPDEDDTVKQYAVSALRDCADTHLLRRLVGVATGLFTLSRPLSGLLCEALYPTVIDASGLADLLRKTESPERYDTGLSWTLNQHLKEKLTPALASSLLTVFLEMLGTPPYAECGPDHEQISQRFAWLCDALPTVLGKLLEQAEINAQDTVSVARSIPLLETHWDYGGIKEEEVVRQLSGSVSRHLTVKREYFWQRVAWFRTTYGHDPNWLDQVTGWLNSVRLDVGDVNWLIIDARQQEAARDRVLAFQFAFELWQPYAALQWRHWFRLLKIRLAQREIGRHFWKFTWLRLIDPARPVWTRQVRHKLLSKHWWKRLANKFRRWRIWVRDQYILHLHLYRLYSGTATGWLMGLSNEAQSKRTRWAVDDWSSLRKKRGPLIVWATQHGCEVSWRGHTPLLPHEKPVPNQTSGHTIIGLCGLQSLWQKGKIGFTDMSTQDANRVAWYALCELNGFADWLPELARAQPQAVRQVFQNAMRGEWQFPADRTHFSEVLSKLKWQGERYWPLIAQDLLTQLQIEDPQHPAILNYAISILLKSATSPRRELAVLAAQRVINYPQSSPFFIGWMLLWLQLEAIPSITYLSQCLNGLPTTEGDDLMLRICNALHGGHLNSAALMERPDYLQPQAIRILVPLVYKHIRPNEDIDRAGSGVYHPTERDDAQEFRNGLLPRFAQMDHPQVLAVLKELHEDPQLSQHRDWITHLIEEHAKGKVDLSPWQEQDIRAFATEFETNPRTDTDLFRIACWRIQDIKKEVERAENSLREEVRRDWLEPALRRWFQRKLNDRSRQKYTIPQEAEIDQQQREDLRFENPSIPSAVPVEIKWADRWSAVELLERLENQLVGQYLRAHNIRYGIYLLGYIGRQRHWNHPTEQRRIDLSELIRIIERKAQELEQTRLDIAKIRVIAVDFTVPS